VEVGIQVMPYLRCYYQSVLLVFEKIKPILPVRRHWL
jgi:hypothetical protein